MYSMHEDNAIERVIALRDLLWFRDSDDPTVTDPTRDYATETSTTSDWLFVPEVEKFLADQLKNASSFTYVGIKHLIVKRDAIDQPETWHRTALYVLIGLLLIGGLGAICLFYSLWIFALCCCKKDEATRREGAEQVAERIDSAPMRFFAAIFRNPFFARGGRPDGQSREPLLEPSSPERIVHEYYVSNPNYTVNATDDEDEEDTRV